MTHRTNEKLSSGDTVCAEDDDDHDDDDDDFSPGSKFSIVLEVFKELFVPILKPIGLHVVVSHCCMQCRNHVVLGGDVNLCSLL